MFTDPKIPLNTEYNHFSKMIMNLPIAVLFFEYKDKFYVLSEFTPAADKILNQAHSSLLGKPIDKVFQKLSLRITSAIDYYAHKGEQKEHNKTLYHQNIENHLFDIIISQIDETNLAISFVKINNNDKFKENLIQNENRNKALISANPDTMCIVSRDGILLDIISFKLKLPKKFLYSNISKSIYNIFDDSFHCLAANSLNQLFLTEKKQHFQCSLPINGTVYYFEFRLTLYSKDSALFIIQDISKQEWLIKELNYEQNLINLLLENTSEIIYFKDTEGRFIRINKATLKYLNTSDYNEVIGKTDFDFLEQEHAEKATDDEKKVMQTAQPLLNYDEAVNLSDGTKSWFLSSKFPLFDNSGNIIGTYGISHDITERKKAEQALQESEKRFRLLVEHSSDMLVYIDLFGRQKYISPSAEHITGFTTEELQKPFYELLHPEDVEYVLNGFKELLENPDKTMSGEYRHLCKDGSYKYMENISRNYMKDPMIQGIVSNVRDITERRQAQNEIIKQNKEYERLNEELTDANAKISSINSALVHAIKLRVESEKKLIAQNDEYQLLNKELKDSFERIEKINKELIITKEKAEKSDQLKSEFLSNMSHELRTPMNGLIGFSQMISLPNMPAEKRAIFAEQINNCCNQLLIIINNIIEMSEIETNQVSIFETEVNINELLKHQYFFFKPIAATKKLSISVDCFLPTDKQTIITDETKIKYILTNLIENALKFTHKGSVSFGCEVDKNFVFFHVKDTGIGIDNNFQNIIFERFRQVEFGTTRNYGGTGLGLSIAKALVILLGGDIGVESSLGRGSTFHFKIPFKAKNI
jgi:PAS domain S-box-containing protein